MPLVHKWSKKVQMGPKWSPMVTISVCVFWAVKRFTLKIKKQLDITIYIYHRIQRSASQHLSIFESRCIQLIDAATFLFAKAREDDRPDLFHNLIITTIIITIIITVRIVIIIT